MYITVQDIADHFSCSKHLVYEVLTQLPDEELAQCRLNITLKGTKRNYRYEREQIIEMFVDFFKSRETRRANEQNSRLRRIDQ